jgi:Uncharacterized protein conserved in bacteria
MARSNIAGMIESLIAPLIDGMGIELVDVEFVKEGSRYYLRVFIDKPGGINLDDCQAVSEKLDVFWTRRTRCHMLIPWKYHHPVLSGR